MSEDTFRRYGAYYDLLYRDKDYAAESAYISGILRDHGLVAGRLLEFGSGTGIHGRLLAARGFDILGIERSEAMAAVAEAAAPNCSGFKCLRGDLRTVRLPDLFDGVLALFHVISYQTSNTDVAEAFANAARHLRPAGLFFFDVWHGPAVLKQRPAVRVKRVEDASTRLVRVAEPELDANASVVTVDYTLFAESKSDSRLTTFTERHRVRYFFPVEIGLLAQQAGFAVESSREFLTGQTPSEATWGVGYVLRKVP